MKDIKVKEKILIEKGWSEDKKYKVISQEGIPYLLRVSPIERKEKHEKLFPILKELEKTGIPMCNIIATALCDNQIQTLYRWIDGEDAEQQIPKLPQKNQYELGKRSGEILKQIHSLSAPADQEDWHHRFFRKTQTKIEKYNACPIKFYGDQSIINYLQENHHLLQCRPQSFQHGDYHVGNMMISQGEIAIIDFDRYDFGDPWEEFNRIVWNVAASIPFSVGQLHGYFKGEPPEEFFHLLQYYIFSNVLSSIYWAIPFGESEVEVMIKQSQQIQKWYENSKNSIPSWYFREGSKGEW